MKYFLYAMNSDGSRVMQEFDDESSAVAFANDYYAKNRNSKVEISLDLEEEGDYDSFAIFELKDPSLYNEPSAIDEYSVNSKYTAYLDKRKKTYEVKQNECLPDTTQFIFKYEYRIDGNIVQMRLLEFSEYCCVSKKPTYYIRDNVVLESDMMRTLADASGFDKFLLQSEVNRVKQLMPELEWREAKESYMRFHILSRHDEIISEIEFRKLLRTEIERIKRGVIKAIQEASKINIAIEKTEQGYRAISPKKIKRKELEKNLKFFSDEGFLNKFNITLLEFEFSTAMIKKLTQRWLREKFFDFDATKITEPTLL